MPRKIRPRPIQPGRAPIRLFTRATSPLPINSLGDEILRRLAADNLPPARFVLWPGAPIVARGEETRARRAGG